MTEIDVSLKSIKTTGSITQGTNVLRVADPTGFAVGDQIIVEIGTEAGGGARGTFGVGGTWPQTNYATTAALLADTSNIDPTWAWAQDTGTIWEWSTRNSVDPEWSSTPVFPFYTAKAVPRSLVAVIAQIDGSDFTLSITRMLGPTLAVATATDANVYYDNALPWYVNYGVESNKAQNYGNTLKFPAGTFYVSQTFYVSSNPDDPQSFEIRGAGIDQTIIKSPKGVCQPGIITTNAQSMTVSHMSFVGNIGDEGFGLNWGTITADSNLHDHAQPQGYTFPRGVVMQNGDNHVIHHVKFTDSCQHAIAFNTCGHCRAYDNQVYNTAKIRSYIQWLYQLAACHDSSIDNNYFYSPYITPCFELFASTDCSITNMTAVNGVGAVNCSNRWQIVGMHLTFAENAGAYSLEPDGGCFSLGQHAITVSYHQQVGDVSGGGKIINPTIIFEGPVQPDGSIVDGINISDNPPITDIEITGTYPNACNPVGSITFPDQLADVAYNGFQIDSVCPGTVVTGIRTRGLRHAADPRQIAIDLQPGCAVVNCVADSIDARIEQSGCQTNAQFEANYPDWYAANCRVTYVVLRI